MVLGMGFLAGALCKRTRFYFCMWLTRERRLLMVAAMLDKEVREDIAADYQRTGTIQTLRSCTAFSRYFVHGV